VVGVFLVILSFRVRKFGQALMAAGGAGAE
jgi:hypothetical protein